MLSKNKLNHFRWRWGDRYDGWRVRKVDPVFRVIPYVLRTRMDAQNFFEEKVPIDHIEAFIKKHKEAIPDLSIMHVIMAATVRLFSQRPHLNRFVVWNKIFARNHINFSIAIKRSLTDNGEETLIKPYFQPEDTLSDVVRKTREVQLANQQEGVRNSSDTISRILGTLPDWLMRVVAWTMLWTDKVGILPRFINEASPWHCSVFLTNIGSIGIESIYHHLYEFGTCSNFVAMGKKTRFHSTTKEGELVVHKQIRLKFVLDERICDGYYFASSLRLMTKYLMNPEILLTPPANVVKDEGV
ncbi:MAG: hypothetical protein BGP01_15430 [Paludibacter sp. 47-17]|nr:MAG: hypothetical protein BGP01_15430 [Paludibacter sp. 47-17]